MVANSAFRVGLLITGVVVLVAGVGSVAIGYGQTQAADEWDSQQHYCGTAGSLEETREISCPTNPHAGGEVKIGLGIVLALIGGVATRYGAS